MPAMSTSSMPMRNTTDGQHGVGQVLRAARSGTAARRARPRAVDELGELRLRPPALSTICVLVGLPLTTNVPGQARGEVRQRQADQVDVLVVTLLVARRVGPRGGGALRQDDDEHRERDGRQQGGDVRSSSTAGRPKVGNPPGTGPSMRDAVAREVRARSSATIEPTTAISAPGIRGVTLRQADDDDEHGEPRRRASGRWSRPMLSQRGERLARSCRRCRSGTPSMPASWPMATWMPTPVRKPIEHLARQEVGQEGEPDDAGQEEPAAGEQGRGRGQRHVLAATPARRGPRGPPPGWPRWRSPRRPPGGGRSRTGRRRRSGTRMVYRPVTTGTCRRSFGVAHDLGDAESGERRPRRSPRPRPGSDSMGRTPWSTGTRWCSPGFLASCRRRVMMWGTDLLAPRSSASRPHR